MNIKTFVCVMGLLFLVAGIAKLMQQYNRKKRCTAKAKGYVSFIPFEAPSETSKKLLEIMGDISKNATRGKKGFAISEAYSEVITYSIDGVEYVTHTGHRSNNTDNLTIQ